MKKTGLVCLFLFTFLLSSLFCQTEQNIALQGKNLSDYLYEEISLNGYRARKSQLCRSEKNNFPYNIVISIRQSQGFALPEERQYNSVMFVFSQEDIVTRLDYLYDLINYNLNTDYGFNVSILLSASDKQPLAGNEDMTGTELYCENIEGSESICAIPINFSNRRSNSITPGSAKQITPLWLLKLITNSLEKNNIYASIKGGSFMSLYKLGILQSSNKLASFLSRNIPAVEINLTEYFSDRENFNLFFEDFLNDFSKMENFQADIHYIPISIAKNTFYIGEHVTIIFLLIIITISLVIFSDLGFIFRKKHSKKTLFTKRALNSIYLIPLTIFVSTLCLELSQLIASAFYRTVFRNPLMILGLKIVIAVILISFAYLLELKFHKKTIDHVYGYLITISSLLNIFIFSAIDITLFYIFAVIYLILLISRLFKKTIIIYFFLFLSVVPYFQLIYETLIYSSMSEMMSLIISKPLLNILLSSALTPIYISILRILVNINFKEQQKQRTSMIKSKFPKYYALIQATTTVIFISFFFTIAFFIQKQFFKKFEMINNYGNINEVSYNHLLSVKYDDTNYYGGTIRRLSVSTTKDPVRVEILISGESDNPVYYTTYSCKQIENSNKVKFILPDYPPEDIFITYTPDNSLVSSIEVSAYYSTDVYPEEYTSKLNINTQNTRRKTYIKEKQVITIDTQKRSQN